MHAPRTHQYTASRKGSFLVALKADTVKELRANRADKDLLLRLEIRKTQTDVHDPEIGIGTKFYCKNLDHLNFAVTWGILCDLQEAIADVMHLIANPSK